MNGMVPQARISLTIPPEELEFSYVRSSGSGGQNVNKVNSKAILRWNIFKTNALTVGHRERFLARYRERITADGDIIISSDRFRDQGRNARDCLEKLKELLASVAVAPKKRIATKPTFGAKKRRLEGKKATSEKKRSRQKQRSWGGED